MNDVTGTPSTTPGDGRLSFDVRGIMELLPHRPPMLLIDRLIDIIPGVSATGIKCVTMNEPYFAGHFPGHPVMPGVMIIESMAQAAGAMVVASLGPEGRNKLVYFTSVDNARFRHPVGPGDTMYLKVRVLHSRPPVWRFSGAAYVGDVLCADAEFAAMIMEPGRKLGKSNG